MVCVFLSKFYFRFYGEPRVSKFNNFQINLHHKVYMSENRMCRIPFQKSPSKFWIILMNFCFSIFFLHHSQNIINVKFDHTAYSFNCAMQNRFRLFWMIFCDAFFQSGEDFLSESLVLSIRCNNYLNNK